MRLPLRIRILLASSTARVQPEGLALALVLAAQSAGQVELAGPLIAASTLPQLVTGPAMGRTLDRAQSRERVVALCAIVAACACALLAVSDLRLVPALAATGLLAVTSPVLTGGLSSVVMGWSDDDTTLAAWDGTGYNVAGLAAPVVVTVAAAWRPWLAFASLGGITALALVPLLAHGTPSGVETGAPVEPDVPPPRIADAVRAITRSAPLLASTIATTAFSLGLGGLEIGLAAAVQARGLPVERAGVLATAIAAGALVGSLLMTRSSRRRDAAWLTIAAVATSGGLIMLLAGAPWVAMVPVAVAIGLADAPLLVGTYRARSEHAPARLRSGVFTIAASAKLGVGAIGALLVGAVAGGSGSSGLVFVGATGVVGAISGALIRRRYER
jgi:hypothetical protein